MEKPDQCKHNVPSHSQLTVIHPASNSTILTPPVIRHLALPRILKRKVLRTGSGAITVQLIPLILNRGRDIPRLLWIANKHLQEVAPTLVVGIRLLRLDVVAVPCVQQCEVVEETEVAVGEVDGEAVAQGGEVQFVEG